MIPTAADIDAWRGKTILVLGDVMLDCYVYGDVERISPEGPIPVMRMGEKKLMLGGAGNVARNIVAMGASALLLGALGTDDNANRVSQIAESEGIETIFLRSPSIPTTVKTRFVSRGQQLLRLDVERYLPEDPAIVAQFAQHVAERIGAVHALVLSDYAKGLLSPSLLQAVIGAAKSAGIPVVADPKSRDLSRYDGADVITPNAGEAAHATGLNCRDDNDAAETVRAIRKLAQTNSVVLTRGSHGMTVYAAQDGGDTPIHIRATASEVFDVSGAGDTVIAALALGIASGLTVERAARLANLAAGIAVAKLGTAAVSANELMHAVSHGTYSGIEAKICTPEEAAVMALRWRNEGLRVGFANGCFDLIHPGHVMLLQKARAACDRLIVALNSDASVNRLKGPSRPVQVQTARALVMASIASTDIVTIFDEDTPLELIAEIRPDVLIKGSDYTIDRVVGAELVAEFGGKVVLVPLEDGHSTSAMINRSR